MGRIGDHIEDHIGILGGTFDPPHLGHLILAEGARDALGLTRILFVPAADPPHKNDHNILPIAQRIAMLQLAIRDNPTFAISTIDVTRPGPHFTVDTLTLLQQQYPAASLTFLLGGDSLHDIPTWRNPRGIIEQARIAVMMRPGAEVDLDALEALVPGLRARLDVIAAPAVTLSATMLRERLLAGRSVRYIVPEAVVQYINENELYRT